MDTEKVVIKEVTSTTTTKITTTTKRKAADSIDHTAFSLKKITSEFGALQKTDTRGEMGMSFSLVDEADVRVWACKWHYDVEDAHATETQKRLKQQLEARKLSFIEFRIVFPDGYPREAPFFYNHYPRLIGSYIFGSGGLCAETLSSTYGWSCASKTSALALSVRSLLENAGCRLQSETKTDEQPFSEEGARRDFSAISNIHAKGWHGSAGNS